MEQQRADQSLGPRPDPMFDMPDRFLDLVRDALLHLYDPARLQSHPLLAVAGEVSAGVAPTTIGGRVLRQALLDGIDALRPGPGVAAQSRAWRAYRIAELRYLEALDVAAVIQQVAVSKSQYHREHQRALHGVAATLWERWSLAGRWADLGLEQSSFPAADLARLEAQQLRDAAAVWIDVLDVLRGARFVIEPLCATRGIHLQLELPETLPPIVGDRVALRQAILTILGHAAAAVEQGMLRVTASAEHGAVQVRVSGPLTAGLDATRLGIVESRPFVDALGGSVRSSLDGLPDDGWMISLEFPAEEPAMVLVVDNNDDFRRLVARYLSGYPWVVEGAASVDEAYLRVRRQRPVAILLDVVLPGRDGWDLLLDLKQTPATHDIPVIICSVLDEPAVATALGAAAYLQKPIGPAQLVAMLESVAARKPRRALSVT